MPVRRLFARVVLSALLVVMARAAGAQTRATTGSIHGQTTTQSGVVPLPGVAIVVLTAVAQTEVAATVSDAQGRFRAVGLRPGDYDVRATLGGFAPVQRRGVRVVADSDVSLDLDIALAMSTTVDAQAVADDAPITGTSQSTLDARLIDVAPLRGDDYRALLPLVPGVVRGVDGRINFKGGRPTETGLQIDQTYASDPVTGDALTGVPVDAVSTVEVLPNPYSSEYGRFSAGVVRLDTRKGGDAWRATANNFVPVPCLKLCDGSSWGIRSFDPRLIVTGPVIAGRLFLAQSLQYHDHRERVTSLPRAASDTGVRSLDVFTRVDAVWGAHRLVGAVSASPENRTFVGLDTFHPQAVSPDVRRRGLGVSVADTWRWSGTTLLETSVARNVQRLSVLPRSDDAMVVTPDGVTGAFFNTLTRRSDTTQVIAAMSTVRSFWGDHVLKGGVDVLRSSFEGTSQSHLVEIRREDGTLSERWSFGPLASQSTTATDVGAYVQDRWRVSDRAIGELGARFDRDGVTRQQNVSPRLGFVFSLRADARSVVRGGVGRFIGRTPLLAATFEALESGTVGRYGQDGVTPVAPEIRVPNVVAGRLEPSSSRVWNLEYDHRIRSGLLLKFNYLERAGTHELLVAPAVGASAALALASRGRSRYREAEATLHYARKDGRELTMTYVRSRSRADLNAFDAYFGTIRQPIVRANEFGPTSTDAPNRLLAWAVLPIRQWTLSPLLEVRSGFPYSVVDAEQMFVGPRNAAARFPAFTSLDFSVLRVLTVRGRRVRVGLRSNHLIGNFSPRDVQINVASPTFGTFSNPIPRRLGFTVELEP
ncbi:MAG: TonB-dependent receptor [Acidobacteriota bacterium]